MIPKKRRSLLRLIVSASLAFAVILAIALSWPTPITSPPQPRAAPSVAPIVSVPTSSDTPAVRAPAPNVPPRIIVLDEQNRPIAGARVYPSDSDASWVASSLAPISVSDADGIALLTANSLSALPPRTVLVVLAFGHSRATLAPAEIAPSKTVTLGRQNAFHVICVSVSGEPLLGVLVGAPPLPDLILSDPGLLLPGAALGVRSLPSFTDSAGLVTLYSDTTSIPISARLRGHVVVEGPPALQAGTQAPSTVVLAPIVGVLAVIDGDTIVDWRLQVPKYLKSTGQGVSEALLLRKRLQSSHPGCICLARPAGVSAPLGASIEIPIHLASRGWTTVAATVRPLDELSIPEHIAPSAKADPTNGALRLSVVGLPDGPIPSELALILVRGSNGGADVRNALAMNSGVEVTRIPESGHLRVPAGSYVVSSLRSEVRDVLIADSSGVVVEQGRESVMALRTRRPLVRAVFEVIGSSNTPVHGYRYDLVPMDEGTPGARGATQDTRPLVLYLLAGSYSGTVLCEGHMDRSWQFSLPVTQEETRIRVCLDGVR